MRFFVLSPRRGWPTYHGCTKDRDGYLKSSRLPPHIPIKIPVIRSYFYFQAPPERVNHIKGMTGNPGQTWLTAHDGNFFVFRFFSFFFLFRYALTCLVDLNVIFLKLGQRARIYNVHVSNFLRYRSNSIDVIRRPPRVQFGRIYLSFWRQWKKTKQKKKYKTAK